MKPGIFDEKRGNAALLIKNSGFHFVRDPYIVSGERLMIISAQLLDIRQHERSPALTLVILLERLAEQVRVKDFSQNFQRINQAWTRTIEVLIAICNINFARFHRLKK